MSNFYLYVVLNAFPYCYWLLINVLLTQVGDDSGQVLNAEENSPIRRPEEHIEMSEALQSPLSAQFRLQIDNSKENTIKREHDSEIHYLEEQMEVSEALQSPLSAQFRPQIDDSKENTIKREHDSEIHYLEEQMEVSEDQRVLKQIKIQEKAFVQYEIRKQIIQSLPSSLPQSLQLNPIKPEHVRHNVGHILTFINHKNKSWKIIQKIMQSRLNREGKFTAKGFYSYQNQRKRSISKDVNVKNLITAITVDTQVNSDLSAFTLEEHLFYTKVCRIAVRYYLAQIAPLDTLISHRKKKTKNYDYIKVQRYLSEVIDPKKMSNRQKIDQKVKSRTKGFV